MMSICPSMCRFLPRDDLNDYFKQLKSCSGFRGSATRLVVITGS